ncbi:MAG: hypothetical protein KGQ42_01080 [Alphaproteobacteria bacterium]|nr:hypothetical protein [Alphaproteobacteria bacterium]MDE2042262.1 hypothetical protein [Alphaproteobacteria bacterium]MDE2340152.1 hypothetical protein [Alphaproteobacteria bacterium]
MFTKKSVLIAVLTSLIAIAPVAASANHWNRTHPARTHDSWRMHNQQRRITQQVREGDLTHAQAHALRRNDRAIRAQMRADARANHNGGHLNRMQARQIRHELNANSNAIGH